MKFIPLNFKKLANHWYIELPHDNPNDLQLDPKVERYLDSLDVYKDEQLKNRIFLSEQSVVENPEEIIQFTDKDLTRYFTTDDTFKMSIYVGEHHFLITSTLYSLLEHEYQLDLHQTIYKLYIDEI